MKPFFLKTFLFFIIISFACCKKQASATSANDNVKKQQTTIFSADSAYKYIETQVAFGARVPNSTAHKQCGTFLIDKLSQFCDTIYIQNCQLKAFDGTILHAQNIIGSFNPENKKRILLLAHWDSRPWCDAESDKAKQQTPVLGADDGASGVGVLLEIARCLSIQKPTFGIDILLTDAEDYGVPSWSDERNSQSWCLGSQYWAKNPHVKNYTAEFGILLDMVGGTNAIFPIEENSQYYAPHIVAKVWEEAQQLGYSDLFVNQPFGAITDDHLPINEIARIPTLDIIHLNNQTGFPDYWHTTKDDMTNISKNTLKKVGDVVLNSIQ